MGGPLAVRFSGAVLTVLNDVNDALWVLITNTI